VRKILAKDNRVELIKELFKYLAAGKGKRK